MQVNGNRGEVVSVDGEMHSEEHHPLYYLSPEVDYFLKAYVPSFSLSLDEIPQEEQKYA